LIIDNLWVGVKEFLLYVLQKVIVEVELPLERPIGHPAPTPQEVHDLVQDLIEPHGVAPLSSGGNRTTSQAGHNPLETGSR
jgi:hypothetical protein